MTRAPQMIPEDIHRQMLEQGIEQSIDAVVAIDSHNRVTHFNAAAERLWGYAREQVLGHNVSMLVPAGLREQHDGFIQDNRTTRINRIVGTSREVPVIRQNGEMRWALMSISRIEVAGLLLYSAVLRDVTEQRRMREEMRLMSLATHETGNAVIVFDARQRIQYLNQGCVRLFGWRSEERLGEDLIDCLLQGSPRQALDAPVLRAELSRGVERDILIGSASGRPRWCALVVNSICDERGELRHGVAVLTEITRAKMYEVLQLKVMDALLQDNSARQVLELLCAEVRYLAPDLRLAIVRRHAGQAPQLLAGGDTGFDPEWLLRHLEGHAGPSPSGAQQFALEQGGILRIYAICSDDGWDSLLLGWHGGMGAGDGFLAHLESLCTHLARLTLEREQAQGHIRQLAFYDALTGLPNRALLNLQAESMLASARRHGRLMAVLFIDLDRFKQVNDSLGHAAGDAFLREIAQRLRDGLRDTDLLARISGDEFIAILDQAGSEVATDIVGRLLERIVRPLPVDGQLLVPSASIGISLYPGDGEDLASLLRHADQAMYQAKKLRRGSFCFYQADLDRLARERLELEQDLRRALENGELCLHYQPQVELASARVYGVEALLRWTHASLGVIPPSRFIPLAEECGLAVALGRWVLAEACRQMADWRQRGIGVPSLSINLTAQDFHDPDLAPGVQASLRRHALVSRDVKLELTESLLLDGHPITLDNLDALQKSGIGLAMDDFGTGYSSLGYLRRLPVRELKLDRLFVCDLEQDDSARALTQAVIHIGNSLGLDVVAEGVESLAQMRILQEQGYRFAQGYLFAPALPAAELEHWLAARPPA